jgi:hypothetical protein
MPEEVQRLQFHWSQRSQQTMLLRQQLCTVRENIRMRLQIWTTKMEAPRKKQQGKKPQKWKEQGQNARASPQSPQSPMEAMCLQKWEISAPPTA